MAKKTAEEKLADKVYKEEAKLYEAAKKFQAAILRFKNVYDPSTVGLDEWRADIDEVMCDISADIANEFEESLFP